MAIPFGWDPAAFPDFYRATLERLFLPDSVIATRPDSKSSEWSYGSERSLWHDSWMPTTSDPDKVRMRDGDAIRLDANVGYGRLSLSDSSLLSDKLTKKVIVARALTFGVIKGPVSSRETYRVSLCYDHFIRWRLAYGHSCNRTLSKVDFSAFVAALAQDDVLSLIPIEARLDLLAADVADGKIQFPSIRFGEHPLGVDWNGLAELLGVTRNSLSSSRLVRAWLRETVPQIAPRVSEELLPSLEHKASKRDASEPSSRKFEDYLLTWKYLHLLSVTGWLVHDPLTFDPFEKKPITVVAAEIGRAAERTRTLHPEDFGNLLVAASKWIVTYSSHVIEAVEEVRGITEPSGYWQRLSAREELEARFNAEAPPGCPRLLATWTRQGANSESDALSLNEAIRFLLVAAGVVIACLSARRRVEVESLKAGCVRETAPGVWNLTTYIAKNLRDEETMPVPAIVATAVGVVERLSSSTRQGTGEGWLFAIHGYDGKCVPIEWSSALNDFAKLMRLPLPKGWTEWSLAFHQLRRGFAVFFYYGFELGSLDALSHMLWHLDPGRTRHYVFESIRGRILSLREDLASRRRAGLNSLTHEQREELKADRDRLKDIEAIGRDWDEVRCESIADRLLKMSTGEDVAIGKGGRKLFAALGPLTHGLAEAVSVGPRSNDADAEIEVFVKRCKDWARTNVLEPVPGVPVHCTCRAGHQDDLDAAECVRAKRAFPGPVASGASGEDRSPDMAYASCYVCLGCVHCAVFEKERLQIGATLDRLSKAASNGATDAMRRDALKSHERLAGRLSDAEKDVAEFIDRERPT